MSNEAQDRLRDLGAFIREQRGSERLSLRRLSELAGISNPYLSQIERGLRRPSAEILQQIARALRISAETLYVQAGFLDARESHDDLSRHILADPHINEEQKQALLRIYHSFRRELDGVPVGAPDVEATPTGSRPSRSPDEAGPTTPATHAAPATSAPDTSTSTSTSTSGPGPGSGPGRQADPTGTGPRHPVGVGSAVGSTVGGPPRTGSPRMEHAAADQADPPMVPGSGGAGSERGSAPGGG